MMRTSTLLDRLFGEGKSLRGGSYASFTEWERAFQDETEGWDEPVDRAVLGGYLSDRIGYAFAAGYECALRRLVPDLPRRGVVSFCVTEEGGAHPTAIRTTLSRESGPPGEDWILKGSKRFVTLASEAGLLLTAATTGMSPEGRNLIRMVLVETTGPGVTVSPMGGIPFIPEISHGAIDFSGVPLENSRVLPGDGYADYIKPFRTIEDLHVLAALLGYLLRVALHYNWPREITGRSAALIAGVRDLALDDPASPALHITLGGIHGLIESLLREMEPCWESVDVEVKTRWERDRPLFGVAEKARRTRLDTAWKKMS
ncbi:MAG: acyl-CoA dehydrogenase family protein [Spirochaetes bacterium]|nr:acyl-CoA dehydrogenase family protein [Spirochaetota bacterium]